MEQLRPCVNDIWCVCVCVCAHAWKCVCERGVCVCTCVEVCVCERECVYVCARQLLHFVLCVLSCVCVLSGVKSTLVVSLLCVSFVCIRGLALQLCVCACV